MARTGVALVLGLALVAGAAGARDGSRAAARARALQAYAAMQRYFYSAPDGSYAGVYPSRGRAQAWPYSQALWATLELARLPGIGGGLRSDLRDRIAHLAAYAHPERGRPAEYAPVYGGTGNVYYDDNLWVALALVGAREVTTAGLPLLTARHLFGLVEDGWDTRSSDPCPGGIFWKRAGSNHDRNAVTTANFALLALDLYAYSPSPTYLAWAKRAYGWTERCLGLSNGLIADHLDLAGRVDTSTWSYNQGAMVADGVLLYRHTHDRSYLENAVRTANAALKAIGDPYPSGRPPIFLAIFYRDLLVLSHEVAGRDDPAALAAFADEAWARARNPKTGLFSFIGRGPTLLDQAAMVEVYAELAGAP